MPNFMKRKIMQIFKKMGCVDVSASPLAETRGVYFGVRTHRNINPYKINNAGVGFMTPEISKKADVVADLGLHVGVGFMTPEISKKADVVADLGLHVGVAFMTPEIPGLMNQAPTDPQPAASAQRPKRNMGSVPIFYAFIFAACAGIILYSQNVFAVVPPPDVTIGVVLPGSSQITLNWTHPGCPTDAVDDYDKFLILRNTASIIDKPLEGSTHAVGTWINASKVVKSNTGGCPPAGAGTSWTDTGSDISPPGLANGQRYYYKIFTGSAAAKYSSGVQTYATPTGVITSGGTGTLLRRTSLGDNTCGGPNNACHNVKTHNSAITESGYWAGSGGWGSAAGVRYGKFVCQTCHQPHSTRNIYVIKERISFPDNSDMPAGAGIKLSTVDYRYREVTLPSVQGSFVMGNDELGASGRPNTSTRICEVCHSLTKYHNYNRVNNTGGNDHNNARQCTECHDHQDGFKPGEGGPTCSACHSAQTGPMSGAGDGPKTYHMVMELVDATTLSGGFGTGTRYPQKQQPPTGDTHKNCLMCHVEMENWSKKANKSLTNSSGRAYNLRKTISAAPTTTVDISQSTNMDYNTTFPGGGICTSCHLYAQTKDTTKRAVSDKTINTPVIDPTSYEQTPHNFIVEGGGYASQAVQASDGTTFKANCTKCHNDTLTKSYQSATFKFGLHDTPIRRLNAPMNLNYAQGTALRGSTTTITVAGTWTTNYWKGRAITISAGAGSNQTRVISTSTYAIGSTMTTLFVLPAWATAGTTSYYLLGDPIEEEVCYRCHSTSTTSNPNAASYSDYYGAQSFKNTRAMRMEQVFGTSNPYGHLIATYGGLHRADEVLIAPLNATSQGWFTNTGTGKHVGCTDCHNPHAARKPGGDSVANAAKGSGTVTSSTSSIAPIVTVSDSLKTWTANQWRGYVVRILSGSGAGQDRLIMSNSANTIQVWTSWETYNPMSTNSFYIVSPLGHPQYGNMLSNATDDAWGVTIGANWPALIPTASMTGGAEYMPTQFAGTFFTKKAQLTGNSDKVYNLCFKCHSAYGWGTSGQPFTIPDSITGTCCTNAGKGVGPSADIAARFNPNNLAHHAVYEKGKNQPIKANWNNPNVFSYYNSSWPYWGGPVSSYGTITITSGTATLTVPMVDMINSRPIPVLPGWFVWIGTQDLPNVWSTYETTPRSGKGVPGGPTRGWFEITSITSLTQFTVTPAATVASTSGFAITAGFGNTMVPPYGPWSVISCTDCHDTDNSLDPSGPHASARNWIVRKFETQDFPWYNGTSVIRVRYASAIAGNAEGANILCLNCHRQDVYGTTLYAPTGGNAGAALANSATYINMYWKHRMSRQSHNASPAGDGYIAGSTAQGIMCMNCHGGGALTASGVRPNIGEIHGTSIGRSIDNTYATVAGYSYRGKRFLVGGAWIGVRRGSTTATGICSMIPASTSFNTCGDGASGRNYGTNIVNYDFESGADY